MSFYRVLAWCAASASIPLLLALTSTAAAQDERSSGSGTRLRERASAEDERALESGARLRQRAIAIRPIGSVSGRTMWDGQHIDHGPRVPFGFPPTHPGGQLVTHEASARVAIDSLVLRVTHVGVLVWGPSANSEDDVSLVRSGNPEIGASFRDTPAPGWRYELGGSLAIPASTSAIVDASEPSTSMFPMLPLENLYNTLGPGWSAYRQLYDTVTAVASARVEWDALPELVTALEVDVPVQIGFDGEVAVRPQVALDVAGRFLTYQLVGLRAVLTTQGWSGEGVNVLLEPFARFVVGGRNPDVAPFLRVAVRLPLGPTFPLIGTDLVGWLGGSLTMGVLY